MVNLSGSLTAIARVQQSAQMQFPLTFPLRFDKINFTNNESIGGSVVAAVTASGTLKSIIPVRGGVVSAVGISSMLKNAVALTNPGINASAVIVAPASKLSVAVTGTPTGRVVISGTFAAAISASGVAHAIITCNVQAALGAGISAPMSESVTGSGTAGISIALTSAMLSTVTVTAPGRVSFAVIAAGIQSTVVESGIVTAIFLGVTNIVANGAIAGSASLSDAVAGQVIAAVTSFATAKAQIACQPSVTVACSVSDNAVNVGISCEISSTAVIGAQAMVTFSAAASMGGAANLSPAHISIGAALSADVGVEISASGTVQLLIFGTVNTAASIALPQVFRFPLEFPLLFDPGLHNNAALLPGALTAKVEIAASGIVQSCTASLMAGSEVFGTISDAAGLHCVVTSAASLSVTDQESDAISAHLQASTLITAPLLKTTVLKMACNATVSMWATATANVQTTGQINTAVAITARVGSQSSIEISGTFSAEKSATVQAKFTQPETVTLGNTNETVTFQPSDAATVTMPVQARGDGRFSAEAQAAVSALFAASIKVRLTSSAATVLFIPALSSQAMLSASQTASALFMSSSAQTVKT